MLRSFGAAVLLALVTDGFGCGDRASWSSSEP